MQITINLSSKSLAKLNKAVKFNFVKEKKLEHLINNIINKWIEPQEDL